MTPALLADAHDATRFGGKAVQLGAALRGGLPVPPGYALEHTLVERVALGDGPARSACIAAMAALGGPVAVRSSAVDEDGAHASFAGQHLTQLAVTTDAALLEAIAAVRASGHTVAALAYRERLGVVGAPRVAVVVQQQLEVEAAGVMFTRCPMTGDDVRLIEGAWGLGEAVVAGLVDPDRFRLRRGGDLVTMEISTKHVAVRAVPGGGTAEVAVPLGLQRTACLDAAHLRELDALASTCDVVFPDGHPHDVEWALAGGAMFLLQRRPITTRR